MNNNPQKDYIMALHTDEAGNLAVRLMDECGIDSEDTEKLEKRLATLDIINTASETRGGMAGHGVLFRTLIFEDDKNTYRAVDGTYGFSFNAVEHSEENPEGKVLPIKSEDIMTILDGYRTYINDLFIHQPGGSLNIEVIPYVEFSTGIKINKPEDNDTSKKAEQDRIIHNALNDLIKFSIHDDPVAFSGSGAVLGKAKLSSIKLKDGTVANRSRLSGLESFKRLGVVFGAVPSSDGRPVNLDPGLHIKSRIVKVEDNLKKDQEIHATDPFAKAIKLRKKKLK